MDALSMQAMNRAFSVMAPELWNDLPLQVSQAPVQLLYLSLALKSTILLPGLQLKETLTLAFIFVSTLFYL